MKKKLLFLATIVFGFVMNGFSQENAMRYELKTNALGFAFGEINLHYEKPVKRFTSINLFAGHLFSDQGSQSDFGNWSYLGGTFRIYQKDAHKGFFFGPFIKYRVQYDSRDVLVLDPITLIENSTTVRSYDSNIFLGLELGTKGKFNETLLYEVYVGAGRPIASWTSSGFKAENDGIGALAHYRAGIVLNYRWTK